MSEKKPVVRKQICFSETVEARAQAIIKDRELKGRSHLIQTLIKEEWERRGLSSPAAHAGLAAIKEVIESMPGPVAEPPKPPAKKRVRVSGSRPGK